MAADIRILAMLVDQLCYHDVQFCSDMRQKLVAAAVEQVCKGMDEDAEVLFDLADTIAVPAGQR